METRVLRYFLAIAHEQSISAASEILFVTQPTLSRQMMELEQELGVRLFNRGSKGKKLTLTEEGLLLKKRAEEILILMDKTENEIKNTSEVLAGDLYIGAAESPAFELIARTCALFMKNYPQVRLHLYSANGDDVMDRLENGILDFGLVVGDIDLSGFEYLTFPRKDQWGLLLSTKHPLADQKVITPSDFEGLALIASEQSRSDEVFNGWLKRELQSMNIVCRYNLIYNASLLAAENAGAVLCLKGLISSCLRPAVRFIPLDPPLYANLRFAWKSSRDLSRQAKAFLDMLQVELYNEPA